MKRAVFTILLFPVIVFLWLVGWSLFWVGSHQNQNRLKQADIARKHSVKIRPGIYVECTPQAVEQSEN